LQKLPEEEQEYYAKEVYKSDFSLELLKSLKDGKTTQALTSKPALPSLPKQKEESTESLPSLIKKIESSTVIIFAYDATKEFLRQGSGFFISQNGDIITNYHVLEKARFAEVKTADGKIYSVATIVAMDEESDIVRISIDIDSVYVCSLPLCLKLPKVAEKIIVYGSPMGLEKTVSDGIISAIREVPGYGKLIQITAPISPGSSGSPVLNMQGEVIGIATFQFIEGQNLNFAIPSEKIADLKAMREKKTITTEELFWGLGWGENIESNNIAQEAYDKALYFIDKKEYEKALPYLEIAIKTDISSLKENVYSHIGFCNGELGNYIKAIEAYKQVVHINPNDANAYYNLSVTYKNLGLYKEAIEACKQAIRIDPNDAMNYYNLGKYYDHLGLYKDAIEAYKQAIRIDPDRVICAIFRFNLGVSYLLIGDINSALNEYNILKNLDINLANELFNIISE